MSQSFEEFDPLFYVRCIDIGLVCNSVISGSSEERVMENTIRHMFEFHAIKEEEMTTCMKLKIREKIYL